MADFGLAVDMYDTNYYRRSESESEERVPIRWMAPESIETNIYNEATDIVSLHTLIIEFSLLLYQCTSNLYVLVILLHN